MQKSLLKLSIVLFISSFIFYACSPKVSKTKKLSSCDQLIDSLQIENSSTKAKWLINNKDHCSRITKFLSDFNYSLDSKNYMLRFLRMKMEDEEYKLDRFIELYCLLHNDPDALIKKPLKAD